MIWNIFRKDWKLLRWLVILVALMHFLLAWALIRRGLFDDGTLDSLFTFLFIIAFLGSGFAIAAVVHLDAIPGVSQDWLVRPIRRRDLILAKILFVVVAVQLPIFVADLLQCLLRGFSLRSSLAATCSQSIYLLVSFAMPILALASMTKNLKEAVAGLAVVCLGAAAFLVLAERNPLYNVTLPTGVAWIAQSMYLATALLGVIAILRVQYFSRQPKLAFWLTGVVVFICLLTGFLPWKFAFALQQRRAANPGSSNLIAIALDSEVPGDHGKLSRDDPGSGSRLGDQVFLSLPLHITGMPSNSVVEADRIQAHLIGADGEAEIHGFSNKLEVLNESERNEKHLLQGIHLSGPLYARFKDQTIRLEIDYSLTLFRLADSYEIPAFDGNMHTPDTGWCMTRMNESGTNVHLNCLKPGKDPAVATAWIEGKDTGQHNPERVFGHPDYAPYFGRYLSYAITGFGVDLPFYDPSGLVRYPVDGKRLRDSRILLRLYAPQDHFTRRLVIPQIRLQDWKNSNLD